MAPPKAKSEPINTAPLVELFKGLGLTQSKAAEAAKNPKSAIILSRLVDDSSYGLNGKTLDEKRAVLVAALAGLLAKKDLAEAERKYVIAAIVDGRLKSVDQVTGV
jgi:glutaminyl-tRNA synthetase